MKNCLLAISLFLISFHLSFSQCAPAIPSNANVITKGSLLIDGGFTPQWICSGDTLNEEGGIFNVYMEQGAIMNIKGGSDTVYVKNWATLNMVSGICVIFHEPFAILNLTGGIVTSQTLCPSLQFDYTNAPANRCVIVTALEDQAQKSSFSIAPNPNNGTFSIHFDNHQTASHIEVYNAIGEVVHETESEGLSHSVDLSTQPKGVYTVKVSSKNALMTKKIVLQ